MQNDLFLDIETFFEVSLNTQTKCEYCFLTTEKILFKQ